MMFCFIPSVQRFETKILWRRNEQEEGAMRESWQSQPIEALIPAEMANQNFTPFY